MAKIDDLQNLDFDKIKSDPLKQAVRNLVADYEKEGDKKFFQDAAKDNIDKLYSMVKTHAPDAIRKPEKKPVQKEKKAKTGDPYKKRVQELATKHLGYDFTEELTEDEFRNESDEFTPLEYVKWRAEKYGLDIAVPFPEKEEEPPAAKPSGLREITGEVLGELTDLGIDLEGEDETIIATTRLDLEEALDESSDSKFKSQVKKAIESFQDFASDISDTKIRKEAIASVEKLLKAMDKPPADKKSRSSEQGKPEKKEPDKESSKKILDELKELEPELEACRATIREYNKKKKAVEGEKPKKTRYTKLKEKLLSLVSLMPDKLKEDIDVQRKTEKILLTTHRELVNAWGMNKVKAKPGAEAIKDKFEAIEEKLGSEVESRSINSLKGGGYSVTEVFKDGSKNTTRLSKATIDWVNEEHGGSLSKVGAKKLLQKEASIQKSKSS